MTKVNPKVKKNAGNGPTPSGWIMAGSHPNDYYSGLDREIFHSGSRSGFMTHRISSPDGFGTLMQMFSAENYLSKRLKMTMWMKAENVESWASPWMRVDGKKGESSLSFDNMCNRKTTESKDWAKQEIVLDVPAGSTNIAFGVMLSGKGKVWIDDIDFVEVGKDVPTTDCPCSGYKRKSGPQNLKFEEE